MLHRVTKNFNIFADVIEPTNKRSIDVDKDANFVGVGGCSLNSIPIKAWGKMFFGEQFFNCSLFKYNQSLLIILFKSEVSPLKSSGQA